MKKTGLILLLALFVGTVAQAQSLDKLFKKYADDERFEYTSVGKGMLSLFSIFTDYTDLTDGMMSKISGIKVLRLDADSTQQALAANFSDEIDKIIEKGKFETSLESREKNEKTYVYKRVDKKSNADLLILTKDYKGISLIWMKGRVTRADENDE